MKSALFEPRIVVLGPLENDNEINACFCVSVAPRLVSVHLNLVCLGSARYARRVMMWAREERERERERGVVGECLTREGKSNIVERIDDDDNDME